MRNISTKVASLRKGSGLPHNYHGITSPSKVVHTFQNRLCWLTSQASSSGPDKSEYINNNTIRFKLLKNMLLAAGGAAVLFTSAMPPPAYAFDNKSHVPTVEVAMPMPSNEDTLRATPVFLESKQPLPSSADLSPEELATVKLFQDNTASVVNIANIVQAQNPFSMDVMKIPQGQGSGFIWDNKGHIVTNYHVIRGASEVRVALIDQSVYPAKIIGGDPSKDVAVIQLEAPPEVIKNLKPIALGQSSSLFVGQRVFAIGNPFGLDHSLTQGIISGLNRQLSTGNGPSLRGILQVDASINPGNSGGPLLSSRGKLIGINTAIADPTGKGSSSGVGFAIPVDSVRGLVDQILKYGRVVRPVLGVTIAPPQALRQLGLQGVLVLDVSPQSPAGKAGILGISKDRFGRVVIGDVIVGINGKEVKREVDLFDILDDCKVGDKVVVTVLRNGTKKMTLQVILAERAPTMSEQ